MRTILYSPSGEKISEIILPPNFDSNIREDIALKYFEAEKFVIRQPYSSFTEAGKRHSASGIVRHRRNKWKTAYGKGLSRVPRKIMYRRGTQFFWIGAEVSNTRGGRSAHPPKGVYRSRKINKKEIRLAMNSGIAATGNKGAILKRYCTLDDIHTTPAVIAHLPPKLKDILPTLKKIFGPASEKLFKVKHVRSGKGKKRGRKYKSNAGLLIVTGKNEKTKYSGLEIRRFSELRMRDLYPLGRLTLYTKKALEEMENAT